MARYAAVLLLLLTAGCASAVPDSQVSQPQPPPAAPRVAAPRAPAAPLPLDVNALEVQLRATKAIGVFTKISLKNQVDDREAIWGLLADQNKFANF